MGTSFISRSKMLEKPPMNGKYAIKADLQFILRDPFETN